MPTGYWESEYLLRPADLTIVGAGIVGMSAALHFKKLRPDAHVRIIERAPISAGGTTRNAGFACFGSAGEWLDDLQVLGLAKLQELVQSRAEGLSDMLQLLGEEAIGMSWSGGWELFSERDTDVRLAQQVIRALPEINEAVAPILAKVLGHIHPRLQDSPAALIDKHRARKVGAHQTVALPWEGMIHTGKMVEAFHRALDRANVHRVHGVQVQSFHPKGDQWAIQTHQGQLLTSQLAVCTNGMASDLIPKMDTKPVPNRVLVAKIKPGSWPLGTYHLDRGYLYLRTLGQSHVLFGGGRHWGHDLAPADPVNAQPIQDWDAQLTATAESWLGPLDTITHRWTGWLGVGQDRRPLIGQTQPGLHHAVRLGGMGVAIGTKVGRELATNLASE